MSTRSLASSSIRLGVVPASSSIPTGIAVTNNHVVTGAAFLQVWVARRGLSPVNARVLGVSECSDLAVIDIDGDDFPYLLW